ncbi:ABC transporter ATP-binding protein [Nisaea sp.]|uniref:ABC transporter ATP-binding protein n=1 Tax=Nisaea sp. TaxID=2024842 RepID=UPI003298A7E8
MGVFNPVKKILHDFWKFSYLTILLIIAIVIISSLSSVYAPYLFSRLVDEAASSASYESLLYGFIAYALFMGLAHALQQSIIYLSTMCSESLSFIASISFFKKLTRKRGDFFIERNPTEIQSAQAQGRQALASLMQLGLIVFAPGIVRILMTLSVLGYAINLGVVAAVLVYGVVFVGLTYVGAQRSRSYLDDAIKTQQENAKLVGNALNSMETLQYFSSTSWITERFTEGARSAYGSWRVFCLNKLVFTVFFGAALAIQMALTLTMLIPRYQDGAISIGDIVLFNTLLLQLNIPFQMIGGAIDDLSKAFAKLSVFKDIWDAPEESAQVGLLFFTPEAGDLEFRNVSFNYGEGSGVENVSFTARRGRVTFITGKTGAGKSTLLKLALKSLEPSSGAVFLDGVDALKIDKPSWLQSVGVVPQEILLLNDTLGVNITLGREQDQDRLRQAARRASILERIEAMPDGFDTIVGERGLKLSGGEQQRVAIARALYSSPDFLILDEASSALDEATEREIMEYVRLLVDEVTVLVVTHRKSSIRPSDCVVEL